MIDLNLSQYDQLAKRFIAEKQESLAVFKSGIETRNKSFNQLIEQIERVAVASTEPMLSWAPQEPVNRSWPAVSSI